MDPDRDRLARLLRDLKLHRPSCLLLHDDGSGPYLISHRHIVSPQTDQVAGAKLAVDGEVEHSQSRISLRICIRILIDQISLSLRAGFWPMRRPLFQGRCEVCGSEKLDMADLPFRGLNFTPLRPHERDSPKALMAARRSGAVQFPDSRHLERVRSLPSAREIFADQLRLAPTIPALAARRDREGGLTAPRLPYSG